VTTVLLIFSSMYLIALDDHTEGFARWWFRAIACLSAFLVGFGLVMAAVS
jgi:hypothetical protein